MVAGKFTKMTKPSLRRTANGLTAQRPDKTGTKQIHINESQCVLYHISANTSSYILHIGPVNQCKQTLNKTFSCVLDLRKDNVHPHEMKYEKTKRKKSHQSFSWPRLKHPAEGQNELLWVFLTLQWNVSYPLVFHWTFLTTRCSFYIDQVTLRSINGLLSIGSPSILALISTFRVVKVSAQATSIDLIIFHMLIHMFPLI